MRLTLRTLLAYRDRVLSESDLNDLHKRIQQSEMAGNLLRRMEALSQRPQLLAPKVDGRGLGGDANSVAEYLDDILQSEKVPELERVCLESDVQLAELTQCHELLSAALNTPVDVPDELRDRIFGLLDSNTRALETQKLIGNTFDSTIDSSDPVNVEKLAHAHPEGSRKRVDAAHVNASQNENPNSQKKLASSDSARSIAAATAVPNAQPVQSPMVASGGQSIRPAGLDLEGSQLAHEVPEYLRGRTRDGWRGPLAIGALAATLVLLVWHSIGPWENVKQMFAARTPAPATIHPPVSFDANGTSAEVEGDPSDAAKGNRKTAAPTLGELSPAPGDDSLIVVVSSEPPPNLNPTKLPEPGPPVPPSKSQPQAAPPGASQPNAATDTATEAFAPSAIEWLPADIQEKRAVLLVAADGITGARRVAPSEALPSGSRIVAPPATRATLDLARQLRWTICGPTKMVVRYDEKAAARPPSVELQLGRALIASGPNAREVELVTDDWKGRISLGDAHSMAAIELSCRPVALGSVVDPRAMQGVLTIVSVDGDLTVTPRSSEGNPGELISLKVSEGLGVIGTTAPQRFTLKEVPTWYRGIAERPIDILAADDLHRNLANNTKASDVLTGLLMSRRPETAAIAAQTMALLGQWDGIAGPASMLNSVNSRSHWTTTLDLVRQILAADAKQATQLRAALTNSEPKRGNLLCDLILGLPEDRLKTDALEMLVGLLESEFLSERVLAGYQLKLIVGKDLGYQANDVDKTVIQQWRRDLANKRIRLLTPNLPF